MLLAYDGINYHGWQIQKKDPSIEEELEQAILKLTGIETPVCGAGRTDAKVHAFNQTASFQSPASFNAERWRLALNAVLPQDICVKSVLSVPLDFHARHSAIGKRYRYLIYNKPYTSPFARYHSWWVKRALNLQAMEEAAQHFLGEHDFSAMRASQCSSPSAIKTLRDIQINPIQSPLATLSIEVEANSFLQHMVRIIVGTLVAVGEGRISPQAIPQILASQDRQKSGKTAPPYGLYVLKVFYPDVIQWPSDVVDI